MAPPIPELTSCDATPVVVESLQPSSDEKVAHASENHHRSFLIELNKMRRIRFMCDVTIRTSECSIMAHKLVLSACSSYFKAIFTNKLSEGHNNIVTLNDFDSAAVDALIDFCYTGSIVVERTNVQVLLPAACHLRIEEVLDACGEFLQQQLDPTNCLGIMAFADTYSCRHLVQASDDYIHDNIQEVMKEDEFLLLSKDQLIEITASDDLNVENEEDLFHAIIQWVKYDAKSRQFFLSDVLSHVRFCVMSPKALIRVSSDDLVKHDDSCRSLIDEAKNHLLLPSEEKSDGPRTRPRKAQLKRVGDTSIRQSLTSHGDFHSSSKKAKPREMCRDWACARVYLFTIKQ
ncbi:kelch-like protein diablo isoform X2 [Symsagittifera roscoffensis]|uniref:kelch-like protein diablo isoform X2 n=1 Tax=Symsagittifera roscoffensis TaxID=84072 RepID=UPI00307BDF28